MSMAQIAALVAVLVAGLWALVVAALWVFQRPLMYPAWAIPDQAAATPAPPGVEAVTVTTADGERLGALWKPPAPGAPVVVSFHGNAATPKPYARRFATESPWAEAGTGVLAIAFRGYPGSTGAPSEAGLLADADAAIAHVRTAAPDAPLVLHGHSLGAAVAVAAATAHPAALLYLEAPFLSAVRMVEQRYPFAPTVLLSDTYRSDARLPGVRADAVLVTHGGRDGVVPHEQGRALAGLRDGAEFLSFPDEDHVSILGKGDGRAMDLLRTRTDPATAD
jgi:fermentation-respiration switch protein FrsA (DUF1100 family)